MITRCTPGPTPLPAPLFPISNLTVNWYEQYANNPSLNFHTSENYPSDFWTQIPHNLICISPGETFVWATHRGVVRFFHHSKSNQTGYASRTFTVLDTEGVEHSFKGPWSSRAGAFNNFRLPCGPCVEGALYTPQYTCGLGFSFLVKELDPLFNSLPPLPATDFHPSGRMTLVPQNRFEEAELYFEPCLLLPSGDFWHKGDPLPT